MNSLVDENFVEIAEFEFASPEEINFNLIRRGYWTDGNPVGVGESAAMALAIENDGIVASNNLSDVVDICDDYGIPIITSSVILAFCLELKIMSRDEIESVWQKILIETKQILPRETFEEYYRELFDRDCKKLLKGYDLENHYKNEKKNKD